MLLQECFWGPQILPQSFSIYSVSISTVCYGLVKGWQGSSISLPTLQSWRWADLEQGMCLLWTSVSSCEKRRGYTKACHAELLGDGFKDTAPLAIPNTLDSMHLRGWFNTGWSCLEKKKLANSPQTQNTWWQRSHLTWIFGNERCLSGVCLHSLSETPFSFENILPSNTRAWAFNSSAGDPAPSDDWPAIDTGPTGNRSDPLSQNSELELWDYESVST